MESLHEFVKSAPAGFLPRGRCDLGHAYKYYVHGKGCTLGVLFEDSLHIYFEWLREDGLVVEYGPEIRYRAWPKREFARLMRAGVWEPTCAA